MLKLSPTPIFQEVGLNDYGLADSNNYDIIQSNMSDEELLLLMCFVLGDKNRDKRVIKSGFRKISFKDLIDEGHILKNIYLEDPSLLVRLLSIVRDSFPKTAKKSFHFFTVEYCDKALKDNE